MSDHVDNIQAGLNKPLVFILAGGAARRMGGIDKGEVMLGGRRLVDHVVERLSKQNASIVFSGSQSYGYDWPAIADRDDGPKGPAAGLWAAMKWMKKNHPDADGFYTVPIDGPLLPSNLLKRLGKSGDSTIAADDNGEHPTFAYWEWRPLSDALAHYEKGTGVALRSVAQSCCAKTETFPSNGALMNINTSSELEHAENQIRSV